MNEGARDTRPSGLLWLALACLASAIAVQYARDRYLSVPVGTDNLLYVESPRALKRMALGYDALLADVYWIRAVQYFGGHKLAERARYPHDLVYPLLDITTTLDPSFNIAYRFGSIFVAEGYPRPPGRPDLAIKLLQKGFEANPERWQYLYDIAFIHYWWLRDYPSAAAWFKKASEVPGSPEWMQGLAAATLARGGDRRAARFLWEQILRSSEAGYMRENAKHRLAQLDVMDEIDRLNDVLGQVSARIGHPVTSWDELGRRGILRRVPPVDPAGLPYVLDPLTGRAHLDPKSSFAPLPDDMPHEPPPLKATGSRR
jgi:tetratricopeptide (TPR) repeat protein